MSRIAPPQPRLEVRDLQIVLGLGAAGSTASAASKLHLTQSAVSRALCRAEEKLGVRLFDRTARGLSPTAAGERLIAGAAPLLAQLVELEEGARGRDIQTTQLRLVCECYTAYRWLPSALANLRRKLPNLEVTLAIEHSNAPVEALRAGEIDVALLTTSQLPRGGDLEERPLFSDEVVFVVASSHPLAKRRHVTTEDLGAHPILTSNAPEGEQQWFLRAVFGRKKPKLEFIKFPLTEAIVDAARAGMGVAVMSEWIASGYLGGNDLVAKRFGGPAAKRGPGELEGAKPSRRDSGPLRRPWRVACRRPSAELAARLVSALEGAAPRLYAAG